jgi:cell division septation protein DedD
VSEPRTHYQVSFTSRQALTLFVALLAALGLAYFFGLMTGLSGRGEPQAAAAGAEASKAGEAPLTTSPPGAVAGGEASENLNFPPPVTAERSAEGTAPAAPQTVRAFEDGEGSPPAGSRVPTPARAAAPPPPAASAAGFRVQVLSVSSRADADAEAARLSRRGLPAHVEPGTGPKGTVYRVRVGPFPTREEAEEATRRLSSEGRRDTWIVPPRQ